VNFLPIWQASRKIFFRRFCGSRARFFHPDLLLFFKKEEEEDAQKIAKNCKKLQKNAPKFEEIAKNCKKLQKNAKKLQKIAKNCKKLQKNAPKFEEPILGSSVCSTLPTL
jgi:hypothetical protein